MKRSKIYENIIRGILDTVEYNEMFKDSENKIEFIEETIKKICNDRYFKVYSRKYINRLAKYNNSNKFNETKIQILSKNIAIIKIKEFLFNTSYSIKYFLQLNPQIDTLLLDLRNNSGGVFYETIKIASLFTTDEILLYLFDSENIYAVKSLDQYIGKYRIFFCMNEHTCSSAEILCGILKYSMNAIGIGKRSFGKDCITQILDIGIDDDIYSICYTKYKYTFKNGQKIENGLEPTIWEE